MSKYVKVGREFDVNDHTTDYYVKNGEDYVPYGKFLGYNVEDPRKHGNADHKTDARHIWSFDSGNLEAWWKHIQDISRNQQPSIISSLNVYKGNPDQEQEQGYEQGYGQEQGQEIGGKKKRSKRKSYKKKKTIKRKKRKSIKRKRYSAKRQ